MARENYSPRTRHRWLAPVLALALTLGLPALAQADGSTEPSPSESPSAPAQPPTSGEGTNIPAEPDQDPSRDGVDPGDSPKLASRTAPGPAETAESPAQRSAQGSATPQAGGVAPAAIAPTVGIAEGTTRPVGASATLTGKFNTTVAVPVWAEVYLASQNRWSSTARLTTKADGSYSIPLQYGSGTAGAYRWRAAAQYPDGSVVRSGEVTLTRTNVSGLTVNPVSALPAGMSNAITGKVSPAASARVWGEVWLSSQNRWSSTAQVSVKSDGSFSIPLAFQADVVGNTEWRVGVRYGDGTVQRSSQFTVSRTAKSTVNNPVSKPVGMAGALTGKASATRPVTVWAEVWIPSQNRWSRTPAVHTSSTGNYSLPLTFGINTLGDTRWRVAVKHPNGALEYTRQVIFTRTPKATLNTPATLTTGTTGRLTGKVSTTRAIDVWAEVWVAGQGRWSRTPAVKSSSTGSYSIPLSYQNSVAGTTTWRVGARHVDGAVEYTRQVNVTRVKKPTTTPTTKLDSRCLTGRVMCASKAQRKMYWVIDGQIKKTFDARFGCPATPSDNGSFRVGWKSYNHTSTIYDTWMPRAMFYNGGEAVHYSPDFAARGYAGCSGGCINIRDWNGINWLYDQVRVGDKVVVY